MSFYLSGLLAEIGIAALGAISVYVILSTGQLSLGNAAFMAIGAYLSSLLTVQAGWALTPAVLCAAAVSGLVGVAIGFPALRLRGIYLAVATLGFGEMTRSAIMSLDSTGGAEGFRGMARIELATIWAWLVAIFALVLLLQRTALWLTMRGIDDDELAAGLVGVNTTAVKVAAFGLGAAIAGVAGALFAHHQVFIEPANFGFDRSIECVLAVILGGSSVAVGAVVGAAIMVLLPEALRDFADWRFAVFGALLVLVLLVRRQGLVDRRLLRWPALGRLQAR
jgi:branched-chain amino acid transport system permease protein